LKYLSSSISLFSSSILLLRAWFLHMFLPNWPYAIFPLMPPVSGWFSWIFFIPHCPCFNHYFFIIFIVSSVARPTTGLFITSKFQRPRVPAYLLPSITNSFTSKSTPVLPRKIPHLCYQAQKFYHLHFHTN